MKIKKLIHYIKGYWVQTILAPLFIVVEVFLEIRIPLLMRDIVDSGIQNQDIGLITQLGLGMVGLAVLSLTAGVLSARFGAVSGTGFAANLRQGLFDKLQSLSFSNIDKYSTPSLITRLTTDIGNVQMAFMTAIRIMFRAPVMLVSATLMAITIKPQLTVVFAVALPLLTIAISILMGFAFPRFLEMLKRYDGMNAAIQENLLAIRVVKAFVRTNYEKGRFRTARDSLMNASIRAEKLMVLDMPIMMLAMNGCILAIVWLGGDLIRQNQMQVGELISFISYVTQILMSLMMIAFIIINFVISRASIGRILEVLDETPDIKDGNNEDITVKDSSIEFKNVSFRYSKDAENNVLSNINLKIAAGSMVGIIGGTGSAKTSLVSLIPRLYDVSEGSIILGDKDIKSYPLNTLRDSVGMVLQKNLLFSGSIRDNLIWGNENATDEEIKAACRDAQADDFITSFPEGYATDLGQGGVNVSGGQKQRLCIARALLKNPKVLILDDSTSAVDTATDSKIREALRKRREVAPDTTTIIIAQRISSISDADMIIVLEDGCINAVGTHDELMANNSIYREVFESQQKGAA